MAARMEIRRGDTRSFAISAFVDASGVATTFVSATDKAWFTIKQNYYDADSAALVRIGTANAGLSGVVLTNAASTGTISILGADWNVAVVVRRPTTCVYDLQLVRADASVTTLAAGQILVLPDVTFGTT